MDMKLILGYIFTLMESYNEADSMWILRVIPKCSAPQNGLHLFGAAPLAVIVDAQCLQPRMYIVLISGARVLNGGL